MKHNTLSDSWDELKIGFVYVFFKPNQTTCCLGLLIIIECQSQRVRVRNWLIIRIFFLPLAKWKCENVKYTRCLNWKKNCFTINICSVVNVNVFSILSFCFNHEFFFLHLQVCVMYCIIIVISFLLESIVFLLHEYYYYRVCFNCNLSDDVGEKISSVFCSFSGKLMR